MQKGLHFHLFLIALFTSGFAAAQNSFSFADYFDQFFNNYYLLNPANQDTSYRFNLSVSDKTQMGLFKGVNQIYFDADLRLSSDKNVFHFIGLQAINNREGEFISKNRLQGRYSWRAQISQNASLAAGIALGFVNYAFNTSQSGAGGSDLQPDGNAGIWYLRKKLSFGFSIQQLFNQPVRPVNQIYILHRYYNLMGNFLIPINPYLNLRGHLFTKFQSDQKIKLSIATLFEFQEKLEAGVNYLHQRGLSYIAGIKKIRIGGSGFSFYFSYTTRTRVVNINDNAIEFFIRYQK